MPISLDPLISKSLFSLEDALYPLLKKDPVLLFQ